jgi:hypothetical protein
MDNNPVCPFFLTFQKRISCFAFIHYFAFFILFLINLLVFHVVYCRVILTILSGVHFFVNFIFIIEIYLCIESRFIKIQLFVLIIKDVLEMLPINMWLLDRKYSITFQLVLGCHEFPQRRAGIYRRNLLKNLHSLFSFVEYVSSTKLSMEK